MWKWRNFWFEQSCKKIRKELGKYAELEENIKRLRDKIYGHTDVAYALENEEIFDIDFEKLNKQFIESLKLLNYIMNECVNLSIAYDNDTMGLRVSRQYDSKWTYRRYKGKQRWEYKN